MTGRHHVEPYDRGAWETPYGRLPASDPALPPDSTRLIVLLSLFAGFCLGTALTIAAYSLRLLA